MSCRVRHRLGEIIVVVDYNAAVRQIAYQPAHTEPTKIKLHSRTK